MKAALIILGFVALATSAPQQRKIFHEHFEDFLELIGQEAGDDLEHVFSHYVDNEDFQDTFNYLTSEDFKALIQEFESLPEFKAVVDFLEKDNIDILYFVDRFNELFEITKRLSKSARHEVSGTDFSSFVADSISEFPKEKLAALFEQKKEEDEEFKVAMENLESEEWHTIFGALVESEVFQQEVERLAEFGIDVHILLTEIKAVFGQN